MFSKSEKFLIFLLALVQFSHIVDFMIMMPLGPQLMPMFNISPQQFGTLVSSYTICAGVSGFLASFFVDRFDRKKNLLFFFTGFSIGTILCGLSDSYAHLIIFRSLTGTFGGVLNSLCLSIISDRIVYHKRATAMGFLATSFSIASIFGVPFSLYLANHFNWHMPFFFLGIVSFFCTFLIWKFIEPMAEHLQHRKDEFKNIHSFREFISYILKPLGLLLRSQEQVRSLIFMFFLMLGHFSVVSFFSPTIVANTGVSNQQLPLVYLVGGICSMIFSPLFGRLSDKYGKHQVFSIATVLSIFPIWWVTHLAVNPLPVILFVAGLFFILAGGRMIPAQAFVSSLAPVEQRGSYMSVMSSVQQFSMAAGSFLAGSIVIEGADGRLLNYPIIGYIAMSSSVFALFIAWTIHSKNQ